MLVALWGGKGADGLRMIISCHSIRHKERFSTLFPRGPRPSEAEIGPFLRFEHQNDFSFDVGTPLGHERLATYRFLCPSDHLTESFLAFLFYWMENKVALITPLQIPSEGVDGPKFVHTLELNFNTDEAVLLLKILNIEKENEDLIGLNHFDRVGGQQPMTLLEDLPLAGPTFSADEQLSCCFLDARADSMRNSLRSFFARYAGVIDGSANGPATDVAKQAMSDFLLRRLFICFALLTFQWTGVLPSLSRVLNACADENNLVMCRLVGKGQRIFFTCTLL